MLKLLLVLPEIAASLACLVFLGLTLVGRDSAVKKSKPLAVFFGVLILAAAFFSLYGSDLIFSGTYQIDLLSQGFKWILALSFLLITVLSGKNNAVEDSRKIEYFVFLSTALLGMMMMASAVNLLTLYISLELSSYSLYILSALRKDGRVAEASSKYLILGAATSGFLLWGMSLVTGISGTTHLLQIASQWESLSQQPVFWLGITFMLLSFLFKLSSAPLHFWAPDAYEASATPVTAFIATASKAAAIAVLIRVFMIVGITAGTVTILSAIAFISMTLGNTVALVQKDVKRLLAYSSIAQAGYILVGLLSGSLEGYSSVYFYALAYVLMNTGAFLALIAVANHIQSDNPQISDFDGLAEKSPFLALVLLVSLLSLAGIPPLAGFTGKWILFSASMEKGHWFLVLWGVLNSVVSLFYYLTLVKHAYLEKPKNPEPIVLCPASKTLGLALFAGIIFLGLFPNYFIEWAQTAVHAAWIR